MMNPGDRFSRDATGEGAGLTALVIGRSCLIYNDLSCVIRKPVFRVSSPV